MKILVTSPAFFNYEQFIVEELRQLGHQVWWLDDRKGLSFIHSALLRLGIMKKLTTRNVEREFQTELSKIGDIDLFLCISPEGMSSGLIERIIKMSKRSILYMWDSFENKPSGAYLLNFFDKIFSFDVLDSDDPKIQYLPLYYPKSYYNLNLSRKKKVLVSCSVHSHRMHLVKQLMNKGVEVIPRFYVRNTLLLLYRILRCQIPLSMIKYVSFESLDHAALNQLYNEHEFVLDISHPFQTGMTNRTWEALASGARLITTNKFAKEISGLSENQLFVLNTDLSNSDELIEWIKIIRPTAFDDLYEYSLHRWIQQLIC